MKTAICIILAVALCQCGTPPKPESIVGTCTTYKSGEANTYPLTFCVPAYPKSGVKEAKYAELQWNGVVLLKSED
jgi:hypothetical protein